MPVQTPVRPHFWTTIAISLIVYAMSSVIHEGIGHGGMCLLTGGTPAVLSSVQFDCLNENKWVAAGGTIANLVFGALFLLAARAVKRSAHWRYFLWLAMTVNLLQGGGYFLYSGVGNIGDWADVISGLQPIWMWRTILTLVGAASYYFFVAVAVRELRPMLPPSESERVSGGRDLMLWPYIFGGIQSCVAGAFNPVGMMLVAVSAAAASFGGTSGLAWMYQLYRSVRVPVAANANIFPPIARSISWMVAAAAISLAFIAVLGPGITFKH